MRHRTARLGVVLATLAVGLVLATAGPPFARADDSFTLTFDDPTAVTVPYGSYWQFTLTGTDVGPAAGPWTISATCTGCPSGYVVSAYNYQKDIATQIGAVVDSGVPLPPGSYSFNAALTSPSTNLPTPTPAQLTVTKAALGVAVRATADGVNPRNAIVTAQLTGDLIDQSQGEGGYDLSQVAPSGTWKISIVDAGGAVAQEFTVDRAAGGYNMATSFSWPDVAAGSYTAKATFAPSGASAQNFTVAPSAPFSYTAPGAAAGDSSTASPAPSEQPAAADSGPMVPGFVLLAAGLVTLALLGLVVFQIVQLARLRGRGGALPTAHVTAESGSR